MPDKKIIELPDESQMTTPGDERLIFVGDPNDGKLYKGVKPPAVGSLPVVAISQAANFNLYDNTNAALVVFNNETDPWNTVFANHSNGLYQWNASTGDYAGKTGWWKLIAYTNNVDAGGNIRSSDHMPPWQVWKNFIEGGTSASVPPNFGLLHNDDTEMPATGGSVKTNLWGASITGNAYGGAIVFHNSRNDSSNRKLRLGLIDNNGLFIDGLEVHYSAGGNTLINRMPMVPGSANTQFIGTKALPFNAVAFRSKAGDPIAADLGDGLFQIFKNTTSGVLKLWANDGGTMKSVTLA